MRSYSPTAVARGTELVVIIDGVVTSGVLVRDHPSVVATLIKLKNGDVISGSDCWWLPKDQAKKIEDLAEARIIRMLKSNVLESCGKTRKTLADKLLPVEELPNNCLITYIRHRYGKKRRKK